MHVLMYMIKRRWQGLYMRGGGAKCLSKYGPFQQRSAIYNLDELVVSLLCQTFISKYGPGGGGGVKMVHFSIGVPYTTLEGFPVLC